MCLTLQGHWNIRDRTDRGGRFTSLICLLTWSFDRLCSVQRASAEALIVAGKQRNVKNASSSSSTTKSDEDAVIKKKAMRLSMILHGRFIAALAAMREIERQKSNCEGELLLVCLVTEL